MQGALIKGGHNRSLRLGVVPKAKTLVSKFASPQETNVNCRFVFRCNHQYGDGDRFRSKQDRKIKNNSINILPIVIWEKEQHSRLNTRPYVREI